MPTGKSELSMTARRIGFYCAGLHIFAFFLMALYISRSVDPQAPMLWAIFAIVDFPISLAYYLPFPAYGDWLDALGTSYPHLAQIFYFPYLLHGLVGSVWWYFLPRLFTPRRLGGIWGK